jgi:hypothetical protein
MQAARIKELTSLAWADAPLTERKHFINAVGWLSLVEAMPSEWLAFIQEWLQTQLLKEPVSIARAGHALPDDLAIPEFLCRTPKIPSENAEALAVKGPEADGAASSDKEGKKKNSRHTQQLQFDFQASAQGG